MSSSRTNSDSVWAMSELVRTLIDARNAAGLSQDGLAKAMGTSQSIVARFEAGTTDPRLSTLERYLKPLGKRLLVGDLPPEPKPSRVVRRKAK